MLLSLEIVLARSALQRNAADELITAANELITAANKLITAEFTAGKLYV